MDKPVEWTPAYRVINTKVCSEMEPVAQLISVLLDTLNNTAFKNLPPDAKAKAMLYVVDVYGHAS